MYTACAAAVGPVTEVCSNSVDDDCDGMTDEGAGAEQCKARDDDCDGAVDEGVAVTDPDIGQPCGTPPFVGRCRAGAIQCLAGNQVCIGEIDPVAETCNNVDDNCNGVVDDSVPGFGGACGSAVGRCTPGTLQCVNGAPDCVGDTGPFADQGLGGNADNEQITDLRIEQPAAVLRTPVDFTAQLKNRGQAAATFEVTLEVDGGEPMRKVVPLEPGAEGEAEVPITLREVGRRRLRASLQPDGLEADDLVPNAA